MDAPAPGSLVTAESLSSLDAFQLFREHARAKQPDWNPRHGADVDAVAEILRLTEGVPLAIELAAAAIDEKTLVEIREGLARRMEFLGREQPALDPRHRSMRASLDYSYGLLSDQQKGLFAKVSVFSGGFFAEDVEAVCATRDTRALLAALKGRSFLVRTELLGRTRYSMLTTVRDYAAEKLGLAAQDLKRAHAQHFLKVLKAADAQLAGGEYAAALTRTDADFENFMAGMKASEEAGDHQAVIDYATDLAGYLQIKGRFAERLALALRARASALALDDSQLVAGRDNNLGNAYSDLPTGDRGENLRRAIECYEAALRVRTEREFPQDWATTQNNLGTAYVDLPTGDRGENLKRAVACYEAALRVRTERDFPQDWATTQNNLGTAYGNLPTGDRGENLKRAIACYEAAARGYDAVGMKSEAERLRRLAEPLKSKA
ncbi:MAG: hypothetical protein WA005_15245 [Candidatus Binataceae bacterium]